MGLDGNPNDPFPRELSFYLAGLGIKHNFIRSHQPVDQPQVERHHRPLDELIDDPPSRQDLNSFQQVLDQERYVYNHQFSSRASDCDDLPPRSKHILLCCFPAALTSQNGTRWCLIFSDFMATFSIDRKINRNGQVTFKGHHYTVVLAHKEKNIQLHVDAHTQEWMFLERDGQGQEQELSRRQLFGMDFMILIGLKKPDDLSALPPIQLTLSLAV